MTRRERLEAKLAKREEWAGKAAARSDAAFSRSSAISDGIPLGQPVLVGHHSEKRHRKDIDRIHNAMSKSCAEAKLAEHHGSKAAGIEHALATSVFSDDPDAVEALEAKLAKLEAKQAAMKAVNACIRKNAKASPEAKIAALAAGFGYSEGRAKDLLTPDSCGRIGFADYETKNNGATIRATKVRIEAVKRQAARAAKAEEAGGVSIVDHGNDFATVTFAEKPERDVLNALREAGFHWGAGSWTGYANKLPDVVKDLANSAASEPAVASA